MKKIRDYFKLNRAPVKRGRSKYMPHQGLQERARRVARMKPVRKVGE